MVEAKDTNKGEDLEEREENVGIRGGEQDKCQECGESTIENSRPYLCQCIDNPLYPINGPYLKMQVNTSKGPLAAIPISWGGKEPVGDMDREVNT